MRSAAGEEANRPGRSLRIAGLVAAGAGVALIAGSIAFGLEARSAGDSLARLDTWDAQVYAARKRDGEAAERNMAILAGAGVAALIGGGVAYLLGARAGAATTDGEAQPLTPTVGWAPGAGPTVGARGSF